MSLTLSVNEHILHRSGSNHAVAVKDHPQSACFIYSDPTNISEFSNARDASVAVSGGHLGIKEHFSSPPLMTSSSVSGASPPVIVMTSLTSVLPVTFPSAHDTVMVAVPGAITVSAYGGYGVVWARPRRALIRCRLLQLLVRERLRGQIPGRHFPCTSLLDRHCDQKSTSEILRYRQLSKAPVSQA